MKSIIIYPEKDRYVLKRIFKIYSSQNLKVDACTADPSWSIPHLYAFTDVLDKYSHLLIVLSSENFNDKWLINLLGYIKGSKKEVFFYFTENSGEFDKVFSNYTFGDNYYDVLEYAKKEYVRWEKIKRKEDARNALIDMGFALSEDALGEVITLGYLDVVKNYLDADFKPSSRNSKGVPLLSLAVRSNHLEIVKFLINSGADINAVSDDRNNTPIMDAASVGYMSIVKLLIDEGAELEYKSKDGQTALILAVGHGDVEISNFLLKAGADYEVKDSLGMSAKSYATLFNKKEILDNMP